MLEIENDTNTSDAGYENCEIKVIGVGGGGCNAVTYMYNKKIKGCSFIVCNTDSQALQRSPVPIKVQMGAGLGAGTDPVKGRNCALEASEEIKAKVLTPDTKMLFITAGMGGGTGTGAAPVIARMAKEKGILTVGVVTLPFKNERNGSYNKAIDGINELKKNVDSLLVINNEKLYELYADLLIQDAFPKADEVLATAVKGITEIISTPGYINVDFEDIRTMMRNSGMALMGSGTGSGKDRLEVAVKGALESPLLNDFDLKTSKNALVNITVGLNDKGLLMQELQKIDQMVDEATGNAYKFKRGIVYDLGPEFKDKVRITVIATGFKMTLLDGMIGMNEGNIIKIDGEYTYNSQKFGVEVDLPDDTIDTIGFNARANRRQFYFSPETKPVLCVEPGEDISRLESEPALRRMGGLSSKNE